MSPSLRTLSRPRRRRADGVLGRAGAAAALAALSAALVLGGCRRGGEAQGGGGAPEATEAPAVAEGRALLEQGQVDAALARLQEAPGDADALYYQGLAWARKAESAPAPTPLPPPSPAPRRPPPPVVPEFKREELEALRAYEQALAVRAGHARAQMGLAQLLAPHAQRRHAAAQAASRGRRRALETPPPPDAVNASPERVIGAFQAAARADPQWKDPLEALILFADAVGQVDAADAAFRQLIDRDRENPDLLVRHGDFLLGRRKDRQAAVARYREALLWRADDPGARQRIGEVYLAMGIEHFEARQYAVAEERLREAQKWIGDATTPAGDRLREYLARLAEIRRR